MGDMTCVTLSLGVLKYSDHAGGLRIREPGGNMTQGGRS